MKKHYSFLQISLISVITILCLIPGLHGYSQLPPEMVWNKTFPGSFGEVARQVKPTNDGGYIMTGQSESFGPGIWSVYVVKSDSTGTLEWNKTYGGANFDFPLAISQTSDNGYIIGTYTTSFPPSGTNLRLIKLDENGDTLWTSVLSNSNGCTLQLAGCVIQTPDGGYMIAGYGWMPPNCNQIHLFKTGPDGIVEWDKNYGGPSDDYGATIQPTNDGNYLLAGYTFSYGSGQDDGYLIKINPEGDTLWTSVIGGGNYDSYRFARPTSDGGYIAVGSTQSYGKGEQGYVVKTGPTGVLQWTTAIGGNSNEAFEGVCENENHEYILTGTTNSYGNGMHDFMIVRLDSAGNNLGMATYGGSGEDFGSTIEIIPGHGYIAAGTFTGSSYLDFWLLKFEADSVYTSVDEKPAGFSLQNGLSYAFPNPFRSETTIGYHVDRNGKVKLSIQDLMGKEVAVLVNEEQTKGYHQVLFNAGSLPSGIYIYRMETETATMSRKMNKMD
ncbi:MAG: T9SS type A sorting domain-containing protein [Bacteroidales bacterium]|nr:T9SS type A sorting domain-containing protein [Bacteroidales bacterium]